MFSLFVIYGGRRNKLAWGKISDETARSTNIGLDGDKLA